MNDRESIPRQTWVRKFQNAFRGVWLGLRTQSSCWVQAVFTVGVLAGAWYFRLSTWQWCIVLLCVATVIVAELFNTALEYLAQAVDTKYNARLRDALDLGSGAVLMASIAAVIIGLIVFLPAVFARF